MLKLNATVSRKIGEAHYGSRGATVSLEVELDMGLVSQPERLHDEIRRLFALARAAVEEELNRGGHHADHDTNGDPGQRPGHDRRTNARRATQSQVRAIHAIAHRQNVHLTELLRGDTVSRSVSGGSPNRSNRPGSSGLPASPDPNSPGATMRDSPSGRASKLKSLQASRICISPGLAASEVTIPGGKRERRAHTEWLRACPHR